jgi:uncharacterized protein
VLPYFLSIKLSLSGNYGNESIEGEFEESKLWKALDKIGIGAIPFLPASTTYARKWLRNAMQQGGWSMAERAIENVSDSQIQDWRKAASEAVLIGVLRGGEKDVAKRHWDWIQQNGLYYIPVKGSQKRFHLTQWIAFYLPQEICQPGAIGYRAKINRVDVMLRKEIKTPWISHRDFDAPQFLYHIAALEELKKPIINERGESFAHHRWTSRLALERARNFSELFLETEPEWRLYEELKASNITFVLKPGDPKVVDQGDPKGRAVFNVNGTRIQYRGASGFNVKNQNSDYYTPYINKIIDSLM